MEYNIEQYIGFLGKKEVFETLSILGLETKESFSSLVLVENDKKIEIDKILSQIKEIWLNEIKGMSFIKKTPFSIEYWQKDDKNIEIYLSSFNVYWDVEEMCEHEDDMVLGFRFIYNENSNRDFIAKYIEINDLLYLIKECSTYINPIFNNVKLISKMSCH